MTIKSGYKKILILMIMTLSCTLLTSCKIKLKTNKDKGADIVMEKKTMAKGAADLSLETESTETEAGFLDNEAEIDFDAPEIDEENIGRDLNDGAIEYAEEIAPDVLDELGDLFSDSGFGDR